ncbi:hypothetical protein N9850_01515 [Granulosicoccus sp.]|nr:hypothetical protein [Granulosicoccus sp.]MDB4222419.1 hypothetical protein [Granulosicoccus sp.]
MAAVGSVFGYRFANSIAFNKSHPDLQVNYLEWWEIDKLNMYIAYPLAVTLGDLNA